MEIYRNHLGFWCDVRLCRIIAETGAYAASCYGAFAATRNAVGVFLHLYGLLVPLMVIAVLIF
jgi:hypothetical protein